jgi:hypothetical protein
MLLEFLLMSMHLIFCDKVTYTARAAVDDFGRRNSVRSLGAFAENQFGVYWHRMV